VYDCTLVLTKHPGLFERGECTWNDLFTGIVPTFESNIAYTLRFMIDTKVCLVCRAVSITNCESRSLV
jgi:hypothetical protein